MDYQKFDDQALLRLMARGKTEALAELYERYGRLVFSVAINAIGEPGLAEEITQDTFLRVWEHAADYQIEQGKLSSWITRIARNRAIDMYRQQRVRAERYSVSFEEIAIFDPPSDADPEHDVEMLTQQQRVRRALTELPPDQRTALALAYFRGLTQEEIATKLGQPLGTVKTRIRLAMQKLRTMLEDEKVA